MQWAQVPSDSQLHICGKPVWKTVLSPGPVAAAKYTSKSPLWNLIQETSGMLHHFTSKIIYCQCRNYRTEVEEYEGTVIYRTLFFYNYVFLGRCEKKNVSEFTPNFFRRSIILVGALLFYNYVFPHFSHISHFRSIINVSRAPFYN